MKNSIKYVKLSDREIIDVVEEAEVPHNEILVTYLPGSQRYFTEKILGFIKAQNDGTSSPNLKTL